MDVYILSLDPGTSMGWSSFKVDISENVCHILDYGILDLSDECKTNEYTADVCITMQNKVNSLINKYNITHVCFEDYFFSKKACNGAYLNVWLRCSIGIACRTSNIHYSIINISDWKKYIAGYTQPSKLMIKQYTKRLALKYMIQEALWVRWKIKFPNFSISEKTHKPVSFKHDQVDAVAIGLFYASTFLDRFKELNVVNEVIIEEDIDKPKWKHYKYV